MHFPNGSGPGVRQQHLPGQGCDLDHDIQRQGRTAAGCQGLPDKTVDPEHWRPGEQRLSGKVGSPDRGHEAIFKPDEAAFSPEVVQAESVFGSKGEEASPPFIGGARSDAGLIPF